MVVAIRALNEKLSPAKNYNHITGRPLTNHLGEVCGVKMCRYWIFADMPIFDLCQYADIADIFVIGFYVI